MPGVIDNTPAKPAKKSQAPKKERKQKQTKTAAADAVSLATDETASLQRTPVTAGPSIPSQEESIPQPPVSKAQPGNAFYFRVTNVPRTALKDDVVHLFNGLTVLHGMGRVGACQITVSAKRVLEFG